MDAFLNERGMTPEEKKVWKDAKQQPGRNRGFNDHISRVEREFPNPHGRRPYAQDHPHTGHEATVLKSDLKKGHFVPGTIGRRYPRSAGERTHVTGELSTKGLLRTAKREGGQLAAILKKTPSTDPHAAKWTANDIAHKAFTALRRSPGYGAGEPPAFDDFDDVAF